MSTLWLRFKRSAFALRPWQRHSLVLTVAGFVYVCLGIIYLAVPLTADRAGGLRLALRLTGGSIAPWAIAWIVVGTLALTSTRWPPSSKTWGYTALTALAALWGSVYGLGVLFLHAPHAGLSGAFVWFLVAFLWWAISGLTNPDDVSRES
jgi:biotin transporter BioY